MSLIDIRSKGRIIALSIQSFFKEGSAKICKFPYGDWFRQGQLIVELSFMEEDTDQAICMLLETTKSSLLGARTGGFLFGWSYYRDTNPKPTTSP